MTTYGDLSRVAVGTRVKFVAEFVAEPDRMIIPIGKIMTVVANNMLDPQETLTLRPEDVEMHNRMWAWNQFEGTVNIGPEASGDAGRAERAPVDVE